MLVKLPPRTPKLPVFLQRLSTEEYLRTSPHPAAALRSEEADGPDSRPSGQAQHV